MRILCMIPALPEDLMIATLQSIWSQSIPITLTVITTRRLSERLPFPAKMSIILNDLLEGINLNSFDYILRVDADTVLPRTFIEENLKTSPDAVGFGQAHLIRVEPFQKLMHGQFHSESDDSYVNYRFQASGYKWQPWSPKPLIMRKDGATHGIRYFLHRGTLLWRFGFEPLHVLGQPRWEWKNLFAVFTYFSNLLRRTRQYDVKDFVQRYQLGKLTKDIVRRTRF